MTSNEGLARPPQARAAHQATAPIVVDAAMYRSMVENATDLIVRGDAARNRTYISPSVREILGFEPSELMGAHAFELVHPEDLAQVRDVFARIGTSEPSLQVSFRMRRKDGSFVWMDGRYRHLPEDHGLLAILRDVTASKRTQAELAEANAKLEAANEVLRTLAHRDGLTGLANRRRFDELAADEFGRARRHELSLGLALLDVDYFKRFNDAYGHLAGDDCLRRISGALQGCLCRPGDHAARYGGEELAVLLPATGLDGAVAAAERMVTGVRALGIAHGASPYGLVTASAGVCALVPSGDATVEDMIAAADRALYRAKTDGRNRVRAATRDRAEVASPRPHGVLADRDAWA